MLTKPAGTRRIVERVADLPSGLSAALGEEYIVRENESIYSLDEKRQWIQVGTYAKHSTVKGEHLAAHLSAKGNPHETKLGDVLAQGSETTLEKDLVLKGRGLRLQPKTGIPALAVGELDDKANAPISLSGGRKGSKTPLVAVYPLESGAPVFVLDGDGNIDSQGEVSFAGGWKGDLKVSGAIEAKGLHTDDALALGGAQIAFMVGKKGARRPVFAITADGAWADALTLNGLKLQGPVAGDVFPASAKGAIGAADKRWAGVYASTVDLDVTEDVPAISVKSKANREANLIELGAEKPGDLFVLTGDGKLGLGTSEPARKLDVRGSAAFGAQSDLTVLDVPEAGVQLGFNFDEKEAPADPALVSWRIIPGSVRRDYFEVLRKGTDKNDLWTSLIRLEKDSAAIGTKLAVEGDLVAKALRAPELSDPEGKNALTMGAEGVISRSNALHGFFGTLLKGKDSAGVTFDVADNGSLDGSDLLRLALGGKIKLRVRKNGSLEPVDAETVLGSTKARFLRAFLANELLVGARTRLTDGALGTLDGDLDLLPRTGTVSIPSTLNFKGPSSEVQVDENTKRLLFTTEEGELVLHLSEGEIGLEFSGAGGFLKNILGVKGQTDGSPAVDFMQSRTKDKTASGFNLDVTGRGAADSTYAKITQDGKTILSVAEDVIGLGAPLNVRGLLFDRLEGVLDLAGARALENIVPAGSFILAVTATPLEDLTGCAFFTLGIDGHEDLFSGASQNIAKGQTTKAVNQHRTNPIATGDAITAFADPAAQGKLKLVVHFLNFTS